MRNIFLLVVASSSLTCVLSLSGCRSEDAKEQDAPPDDQWTLVQNHFFIDHVPKNERDMVRQLAYIDDDGRHVGVRGQSSKFRLFFDVLQWSRKGTALASTVLQTNEKVNATFRAYRCAGKAPAPFELCLELKEGDTVKKLYSRNDWVIDHTDDVARLTAAIALTSQ